jgi:hypothetical protein
MRDDDVNSITTLYEEIATMKTLRNLFSRNPRSGNRFDRYYGGILRSGTGYPTADEARKDLRNYDRSMTTMGWPR